MSKQARNCRRTKREIDRKLKPILDALDMLHENYSNGFITTSEMLQELDRIESEIKAA